MFSENNFPKRIVFHIETGDQMIDKEIRLEEMVSRLRDRGVRLTPQRLAILTILASSDDHPTAERIFERIKVDYPMTSLATVYKTLSLLKELGEVHEVAHVDGRLRFDGSSLDSHPHVICTSCKRVHDFDADSAGEFVARISEETGFLITDKRLTLYGLCPGCKMRQS